MRCKAQDSCHLWGWDLAEKAFPLGCQEKKPLGSEQQASAVPLSRSEGAITFLGASEDSLVAEAPGFCFGFQR